MRAAMEKYCNTYIACFVSSNIGEQKSGECNVELKSISERRREDFEKNQFFYLYNFIVSV